MIPARRTPAGRRPHTTSDAHLARRLDQLEAEVAETRFVLDALELALERYILNDPDS